jgi:hypothetical protein
MFNLQLIIFYYHFIPDLTILIIHLKIDFASLGHFDKH